MEEQCKACKAQESESSSDIDSSPSPAVQAPIVVKTIEHLAGDYGLFTWPCAPVLAQYVYSQREFVTGKRVLELGAGTAVPGVVAAKCGAHVILSDREGSPQLLQNLRSTCTINGLYEHNVDILAISWGIFSPTLLQLEAPDLILASDCFYNSKDFEDVLVIVAYFFEKNCNCKFWTTYQERSSNRSLVHLLKRWGMHCRSIPLEDFQNAEKNQSIRIEGPSESKLLTNHTIHMWEITKLKTT